jgi:flagellar FliL protein
MFPPNLRKKLILISLAYIMLLPLQAIGESTNSVQQSYVSLGEPMVVNVLSHDSIHFLQVTTEFKLKDPAKAEVVQTHLAPIRHHLIMLLSEKKFFELQTVEGKRKLREEALKTVQNLLKEKTGDTTIENIFFTSLVVQ